MCVTNIDQCEINFLIEPNENDVVYAVVFLELYAVLPRGTIWNEISWQCLLLSIFILY